MSVVSIATSRRVPCRAKANLLSREIAWVDGWSWPNGVPRRIDDPGKFSVWAAHYKSCV